MSWKATVLLSSKVMHGMQCKRSPYQLDGQSCPLQHLRGPALTVSAKWYFLNAYIALSADNLSQDWA